MNRGSERRASRCSRLCCLATLGGALVCLLCFGGGAPANEERPGPGERASAERALPILAQREPEAIIAAAFVGKSPSSPIRPPADSTVDELLLATATAVDLPSGRRALVLSFPAEPGAVPPTERHIEQVVQLRLRTYRKHWDPLLGFLNSLTPEQRGKLAAGDRIPLADFSAEQRGFLGEREADVLECDWEVEVCVWIGGRQCEFEWTRRGVGSGTVAPPPAEPEPAAWPAERPGAAPRWLCQPVMYRVGNIAPRVAAMAGRELDVDEGYDDIPLFLSVPRGSSCEDVLRALVAATGSEWSADGPITLVAPPADPVKRRVREAELEFSKRLVEASRWHAPGLYERFPVEQIDFASAVCFRPYLELPPDVQRSVRESIREIASDPQLAQYTWRRGGYDGAIVRFELSMRLLGIDAPRDDKTPSSGWSLGARTFF